MIEFDFQSNQCAVEEHVNLVWWFTEMLVSYKYGERGRYVKALSVLKPYISNAILVVLEYVLENSTWTNPITGKKGY